jgi:hypothetical protein
MTYCHKDGALATETISPGSSLAQLIGKAKVNQFRAGKPRLQLRSRRSLAQRQACGEASPACSGPLDRRAQD